MKKRGIGFKLVAVMLCIIALGVIITAGIATAISGNVIIRESLNKVTKSTLYEAERLDSWLSDQLANTNTMAAFLSSMDDLADTLTENHANAIGSLEDQVLDTVRPLLKSVLDDNAAYFEIYFGFLDGTAVCGSGYQFNYAGGWRAPERGWYKLAMTDTSRAHITTPYVDDQTGELCVTAVRAVINNGRLMGVIGSDIFVTDLLKITLNATLDGNGYSMLIDSTGDILIHPDAAFAPNNKGEFNNLGTFRNGAYSDLWKQISSSDGAYTYKDTNNIQQHYTSCELDATGWKMVSVIPESVVTQPIRTVLFIVIPITVVILVLAALLIYLFATKMISKPLIILSAFMKKAGSTGDITLRPEDVENIGKLAQQNDEIGQTIESSAEFVGHVTEIAEKLETIASGDLTFEVDLLSNADTMGISLKKMVDNLNSMFSEIQASTNQVSTGSKQIADGAQTLAQGSTEQAASIEELSSSIAEIAERTKTNATTADKTAKLSSAIKESAEKGSRQMDEMITAVNEINEASKNIGKIIKTIDDIAFQTNILALNAAVEAARAGQHGKGFAVVAEEVRNLASKSAEAAKDTGAMIQNSMEKAELGSHIAGETAASLTEIVTGVNESTHLIAEIASASEQQSLGIAQINVGIDQVAQVVQQNSATAEESAAASEEMSGQSDMLQQLIGQFKLKGSSGMGSLPSSKRAAQKHLAMTEKTGFASNNRSGDFGKY